MSTGNTLMIGNMISQSASSEGGGLEPKPWWIIVFMIGFIIFELIKYNAWRIF